jgi:hypothetical protein
LANSGKDQKTSSRGQKTQITAALAWLWSVKRGAGQLQPGLGEPQSHLGIGGVSMTIAAAMFATAFRRIVLEL